MMVKQIIRPTKPKRIGGVDFLGQKLYFFAGYTKCEHCNTNFKVLLRHEDAAAFANMFVENKTNWRRKVARRVQKWSEGGKI